MNLLNQSAFLKALGWSLLDSLWQMALLWLVYIVLTANGKKLLSRQRHTIALLSLAGGSLWFVINLIINFYKAANGATIVTLFVSGDDLSNTTYSWPGMIHQWQIFPFWLDDARKSNGKVAEFAISHFADRPEQ